MSPSTRLLNTRADRPRVPAAMDPFPPAPGATAPDDDALAEAALAGDDEALGRLLSLHEGAAYNVAYRILGREADARDAVQDAFLLALRAIRGDGAPPREADRFGPWLNRVVANAALAQIRRRPRATTVPVEDVDYALSAPARLEPERTALRREARGDVLRALLALPETQRAALTLREYQELSYDEIGETLGLGRNATAQLLWRARREFRAAYERLPAAPRPADCPERAALAAALLDNAPAGAAWQRVAGHTDGCARCRGELVKLRQAGHAAARGRPTSAGDRLHTPAERLTLTDPRTSAPNRRRSDRALTEEAAASTTPSNAAAAAALHRAKHPGQNRTVIRRRPRTLGVGGPGVPASAVA